MNKRYLITSALPYASGITHLGNVVGSTLPADIYARYCRLAGRETLYVCGSDEHGVAITIAAEKEGISPRELVDRYHAANESALRGAAIDFDVYGRTTDPIHYQTAQEFFKVWNEKGLLNEREEDQFFDEKANIFLPDRYVEGTCPNCGYDRARGDQCDNCGAYYNQLDLKNPKSIVSGHAPVVRKTKHWYFRLDAFQDWIEQYVETHANEWKDNVVQQSRSWIKQGLAERAATRDMQWGIPVPAPDADGKVLYVWFEAVLGYISATKQWAASQGQPDAWQKWWKDPDTWYTAFLGKDNIVFHTIIFPILLNTRAEEGYILPAEVPANEFLNLEGQKFSKSRNWAIDLVQYLKAFPEAQHVDVLRYVLTMNMPETKDSDFTWRDYQARTNNELAAILGNYVNRVVQFTHKNFGACVPSATFQVPSATFQVPGATSSVPSSQFPVPSNDDEHALFSAISGGVEAVAKNLDAFRFRDAATEAMNIARAANKYFNDRAPWKSIKTDADDCARTINICLQTIRTLSVVFAPFIPHASASMQRMVGEPVNVGAPGQNVVGTDTWSSAASFILPVGRAIGEPVILFTKVEDETVQEQQSQLGMNAAVPATLQATVPATLQATVPVTLQDTSSKNPSENPSKTPSEITIDDFMKVQLRTARVLEAEAVPKSSKLLKLKVDVGTEQRQILAGIAKHYAPEDLVGKMVVIVFNLQPAKLMGLESQGMVLAASNEDGTLALVTPSSDAIQPGAEVR